MCSWEQASIVELTRLRKRIPVMAEKLWQLEATNFDYFEKRFDPFSKVIDRLISPIQITKQGLIDYNNPEGNFLDHLRFKDSLIIHLKTDNPDLQIKYSFNDTLDEQSLVYSKNLSIK